MVTVAAPGPSVLLIGEVGMHLEVHCIAHGLGSTFAPTATACVELMKKRHFDFIVLPPALSDSAPDMFSLWVLQHYGDVVVLLYRDEPEGEVLATFGRQGRFVRIPTNAQGGSVAQYIAQSWSTKKPAPLSPLPPPPNAAPSSSSASSNTSSNASSNTSSSASSNTSPFARSPAPVSAFDAPPVVGKPLPPLPASASAKKPAQAVPMVQAAVTDVDPLPLDAMSPLPLPSGLDPLAPGSTIVLNARDMLTSREEQAAALDAEKMQRSLLEQELSSLREQLAAAKTAREQAEAARADAMSARDRMAASLREAEANRELSTSHAKKAEDARERGVAEVRQVQRELDTARADLMALRADMIALKRDLDDTRVERDRFAAELDGERRSKLQLDDRVRALDDDAKRLASDLKAQSEAAAAAAKQQADTIARLEKERASLESKLNAELVSTADNKKLVEHNQRKLEARIAQLSKDLDDALKKADDARNEIFQARQLRDDAEMHATTLESEVVEARAQARDAARVKAELEALTKAHAHERERGDGLAKELLVVQRDLTAARAEIEDRTKTTSSAAEQVRALEARNRELQDKLADSFARSLAEKAELEEELNVKIAALEKQLVTAQVDAQAQAQSELAERIRAVEVERDEAREKLLQLDVTAPGSGPMTPKDLERELQKMRGLYAQLTVERDAANEHIEKLKLELARKRADAATTVVMPKAAVRQTAEMESLEQRLEDVTRERDQALAALTEASRKLMALEDEKRAP